MINFKKLETEEKYGNTNCPCITAFIDLVTSIFLLILMIWCIQDAFIGYTTHSYTVVRTVIQLFISIASLSCCVTSIFESLFYIIEKFKK